MNEEPLETPVPGSEPVEKDVGQSTEDRREEKNSREAENTSEAPPAQEPVAPVESLETQEDLGSDPVKETPEEAKEEEEKETPGEAKEEEKDAAGEAKEEAKEDPGEAKESPGEAKEDAKETSAEVKEEAKATGGEPPVDWFEPLEEDDDDATSTGRNDGEEESLAGESERSESVAGSERKKIYQLQFPRRKRTHPDEGWDDWPVLGEGWKRKEVVRRSGSSIGQKDVYYMSPQGDRLRSRVELAGVLEGVLDLSNFEYKSGKFYEGEAPPVRVRHRAKKKVRERSSSESSWMERGEGADTPDSHHRLTPNQGPKNLQYNQSSFSSHSKIGTQNAFSRREDPSTEDRIKLPAPSSSRLLMLPSINGEVRTEENTLVCARCGVSFTGTWYDKQRKKPFCPNCWVASKSKEHPMVRFRKWIPCGQCVGCNNTMNCGQCANCKHGLQSPESRKRICRKRKCICPIRKGPGSGGFLPQRPYDIPETFDDSMSFQSEITDSQHPSLKQ